ncbi:MAG TPA: DUF6766 family protein [Candidatus Limnocylindrales bacterium]|jgi:hypothetical protein|nr:DUF6766 family protein [Candidatus Limnocylindrales bacterium]
MAQVLKNYGLSIALGALFVVTWIIQTLAGWVDFAAEQQSHGETPQLFGSSGYFWEWMHATMENWQSEFLQLFTMVVFTAFLIHKSSHESRDSDEEIKNMLFSIEKRIGSVERRGGK